MAQAPSPASFAQQRLWFLDQYEPGSPAYNLPYTFRISGPLNLDALTRAFHATAQRHASLRTVFDSVEGEARQVVLPDLDFQVPVIDLTEVPEGKRESEALRIALEESKKPFDLREGPLLRVVLFRLHPQTYILLIVMHHIITDGWSVSRLLSDVTQFYAGYLENKEPKLPDLPIQYTDYAQWQREYMSGEVLGREVEHWKKTLAGAQTVLELATDHPRPAIQTWHGASKEITLDIHTLARLKSIAQSERATPFMVSLAAFQALLWRYTHQESILVGTPVAGRNEVEVENMIGLFVNTLVFRTDFTSNLSFRDLIRQVRSFALEAYMHQDLPFEKLVEELVPQRSLDTPPLFQVMFIFQNIPRQVLEISGLTIKQTEFYPDIAKFDLSLEAWEDWDDFLFHCRFEYNTDLFDEPTILRMLGHLKRLILAALDNPDLPIAQLAIMSAKERQQILVEWNDTRVPYSREVPLHKLIEEQVEKTPDSRAVVYELESLTYRQLNERANQLARRLQKVGVGPDVLVGVCAERSVELVIALLSILKSGGAYVPLDPEYPKDRLETMLRDAHPPIVLTQSHLLDRLPEGIDGVFCLDRDWPSLQSESVENQPTTVGGKNLAYAIYTSGSTGKPKGVANIHEGIVNRLLWMQNMYKLTGQDRVLQKTPFSFDVSVWEFFWPLMTGAMLVVARPGGHRDPAYLVNLIAEQGITTMHFVPSMLSVFLEAEGLERCRTLRQVFASGEALPFELQQRFFERLDAQLHNLYGPTEAAVDVTYWACRPNRQQQIVPIGRPIANTQIYILDANLEPVPVGVAGELHIGGIGLARGYLNRPDLTAQKFVRDPFSNAPDARIYKTGDLARFLADGNIQYLGRLDNQVKLRGFRIELGEIEAVLGECAGVLQAVAVVREDNPGDKGIVAYLLAAPDQELDIDNIRTEVKKKLPEYMVPSRFVLVKGFPMTTSGKVDRQALPVPPLERGTSATAIAPRNELESKLASIFTSVLRLPSVGVFDNFFDLGGHSLLVLQMIGRIRRAFGVELPVRTVFEAPTIATLALELEKARATGLTVRTPVLKHRRRSVAADASREFPASFAQERLWFLDQFEPGTGTYNMPRIFRITGPLNIDVLNGAFHAVVHRHASLRTVFNSVDGETRQVVLPDLDVKVPIIDLTEVPEGERESQALRLALKEGMKPFDLRRGPLLRTLLIRLGPETSLLLIVMHHIITDGWSFSRLLRDVTTYYAAFVENKEPELPELPILYTDYAQWQREYMSGEVLSEEVEYWKNTLAGAQTVLDLTTDHRRPPVQTWNGADQEVRLDSATLAKLKSIAQNENSTLFMVSMAAFQALLWRYTQQESILVGTPIGARNHVELEDMIGLFVNTLVFRADFTSNMSFRDLIRQVRSFALEAYMHQDLPFEKLVEELVPQRLLDTPPLFQVMFIFQNIPKQVFEISGLRITENDFETGVAKFDLSLEAWEDTEFHGRCEYNTDLFEQSTIVRMLGHFEKLIKAALENPDLPLAQLPIMSAQERDQVLVEWNQTATDYSRAHPQPCIHELFELQAAQFSDSIAVVAGDAAGKQELTYRELNQRANQLAWYLVNRGVGPDVPVALCVDRGPEMMIALLGILKAGGAYVPLDPRVPDDRLSFMLADVKPRLVLTEQKLQRNVFGPDPVLLDSDWNEIAQESKENPNKKLSPQTLAYVMYTSGSTGRPKGVLIEHGSVVNLLRSMQKEPGLNRDDVMLALAIISFDMATPELYLPLISGARMVIASLEDAVDGSRLKELLNKNRVTFMQATPATWRLLLAAGWQGSPDLKLLGGGEALTPELAKEIIGRGKSLWNVYGPTETTVWSTVYRVTGQEEGLIPIGHPIANTSIYILDSHQNPVPVGITGEIYIGGDGLARGYLNRPELTEERFVANPLDPNPSSRLYRTGDLGRFRSNGEIEYVGRVDNQVKLRGLRIELGEIESVLVSHETLREALVTVTGEGEQQRLSCYVVVKDGKAAPSAGELRRYLRTKLPEYMVPTAYWRLKKLPLLPTGKINREALAASSAIPLPEEDELIAPRNEVEAKLAKIWQELLQVEQVGIEQNFFELGGHSLLVLQMTGRIGRAFGVDVPVRSVFESPTIAALALELQKAPATGLKARPPILQRRDQDVSAADATREALLAELKKLSAEEARKFIENAVARKG